MYRQHIYFSVALLLSLALPHDARADARSQRRDAPLLDRFGDVAI